MILPFLLAPVWLVCLVISILFLASPSDRSRHLRRNLTYCSTASMIGSTLGATAGLLFVRFFCSADNYSCMHAGVFFGLVGSLGGLILGLLVGSSYVRKREKPQTK
jgi:uncharacterized YccA/Bax inhibitor family protein